MATKSQIYDEICAVYAKATEIKPDCGWRFVFNQDPYIKENYVRKHTKDELEYDLNEANKTYESYALAKKREEYWLTPEGAALKKELDEGIAQAEQEYKNLIQRGGEELTDYIKGWLGERWVVHFYHTTMEVCLTDGDGKPIFGRDFTIYFNDYFLDEQKTGIDDMRFDVNFGTTGSFNPDKDADMREFLRGLSEFVNNATIRLGVKQLAYAYKQKYFANDNKWKELKGKRANPFNG